MKKLLLVLIVISLLLVACEPEQSKVSSRHEPIPSNYVPPIKENITVPVINDTIPVPTSEPDFVYSKDTFFTDVLVDLESFNASEKEIEEVMEIASFKFKQLTGKKLELREIHYLEEISGKEDISGSYMDTFQYKNFLNNNQGLNGVIVFTKEFNTEVQGGHSTAYHYPDYCNSFESLTFGTERVYFNYIDFEHKYSTCGYDYETDQHVSNVSIGGECRNQPGIPCVFNGNYYVCENSQENYYSNSNNFIACTIVHEFMHPFGELGNYDHYGGDACNEYLGTGEYNISDFQYYCGLCPNIYENFKDSFVEC